MREIVLIFLTAVVSFRGCRPDNGEQSTNDKASYEALRQLHELMDDDHSGAITLEESVGFLRDELQMAEKDHIGKRQKQFHFNDDEYITVDDLWLRWHKTAEHNWTVADTIDWLVEAVDLPQYSKTFELHGIDGATLPRLASVNNSFLSAVLHIKNPVHRHKLQLKAMDVVLFGYRPSYNRWKDLAITAMALTVITLIVSYRYQKLKAARELASLSKRMTTLQDMQTDWMTNEEKLKEEQSHQNEQDEKKSQEIKQLRSRIVELQQAVANGGTGGLAPLAMQPLLRKSLEIELSYVRRENEQCVDEMRKLMEEVERLRQRQASPVQSFKLAFGTSTDAEVLDKRIAQCKMSMQRTRQAKQETLSRWAQIESLCNYPLLSASLAHPATMRTGAMSVSHSMNNMHHATQHQTSPEMVKFSLYDGEAHENSVLLPSPTSESLRPHQHNNARSSSRESLDTVSISSSKHNSKKSFKHKLFGGKK